MKKVEIIVNQKKPSARKIYEHARKLLCQQGFIISKKPDFIMVLGGDGTMLSAAHVHARKGTPILGVNAGGLGFLTNITLAQLPAALDEIRHKKFVIEKRMMVMARYERRTLYALNDITILTRIPGRAVELSATINKEYISRFIADGIIVATPTGSTAYSLATSGPILLPDTEALVVTPVAPHTLSVRPIVLPASSEVKINIGEKGKATLVADGQHMIPVRNGKNIVFRKARYVVRLIKPFHISFFHTLREKMKWGGREDA